MFKIFALVSLVIGLYYFVFVFLIFFLGFASRTSYDEIEIVHVKDVSPSLFHNSHVIFSTKKTYFLMFNLFLFS